MISKKHVVIALATGCYTGLIPFAPGTFGTLPGLFVCYGLSLLEGSYATITLVTFIVFAILIAHAAEGHMESKDPGSIVIDEMAGIAVSLFMLPFTKEMMILGFVVFRFFDIVKPFPIRIIERNVDGGAGIVLDDVIAGVYTNLILRTANIYLGIV